MGSTVETLPDIFCRKVFRVAEDQRTSSSPDDSSDGNRDMTTPEVIGYLAAYGCMNITPSLDLERSDQFPTEILRSGNLYRGVSHDGPEIALHCLQPTFTLNDDGRKQLKGAARQLHAWSKCRHPNVNTLLGIGYYRSQLAIASPWLKNGDLRSYLSTHRLSWVERWKPCTEIVAGLAKLHNSGMVHGDVKAANVFIAADGTAVLTGFGSSIIKEHSVEFMKSTASADLSLRWAAPETLFGQGTPTPMADVWAFGMLAVEVFTGSLPYAGLPDGAVVAKIMKQVVPERPELDIPIGDKRADLLWSLLTQCWVPDPLGRPTAAAVRDKMNEVDPTNS